MAQQRPRSRAIRRTSALLAALAALGAHPARGLGFDRDIDDSCVLIPENGGSQVLATSDPIPAGKTVLVGIANTDTISLAPSGVTDDAGNSYSIAKTDADQGFAVTAVVGAIQHPLAAGQHITLSFQAAGMHGTSCALAYLVDGIFGGIAARDVTNSNFGNSSAAQVSIFDAQLDAPGEFVQTVFYAAPPSGNEAGAINPPLIDQSSFCIGTVHGPMCRLSAYGVLPTTAAFTATLSLAASMPWGAVLVTYRLPEPATGTLALGASIGLALLATFRSRR